MSETFELIVAVAIFVLLFGMFIAMSVSMFMIGQYVHGLLPLFALFMIGVVMWIDWHENYQKT